MSSLLKVDDLTLGERLRVWRRRKGISMEDAAIELNVSYYRYRCWEVHSQETSRRLAPLRSLKPYEVCHILRRRSKVKVADLARTFDRTRQWVMRAETGQTDVAPLMAYWRKRLSRRKAAAAS